MVVEFEFLNELTPELQANRLEKYLFDEKYGKKQENLNYKRTDYTTVRVEADEDFVVALKKELNDWAITVIEKTTREKLYTEAVEFRMTVKKSRFLKLLQKFVGVRGR